MKLAETLTAEQFDRGYWYATELKSFADRHGLADAQHLRKDELETAIRGWLKTRRWVRPTRRALKAPDTVRDAERGLTLDLPVVRYNNDRETKDFLEREATRLSPKYRRRSGARYRLNRWREEQLTKGRRITYRDVVREYVRLSTAPEPFAKVPHVRYVNFLAEFFASEQGATHADGIRAWKEVKKLDVPKTYRDWVRATRCA
jgi:hypothetical protein